MAVRKELLGESPKNEAIYAYHISNSNDAEVVVINYGCIIKNIFVKDTAGNKTDVVIGFDDVKGYFLFPLMMVPTTFIQTWTTDSIREYGMPKKAITL